MKWSAIEKLGNSRMAKSSYYWFFLIPIIAKLFQNIPEKIHLKILSDEPIPLNLVFPFSWYILFAVGILFIISNLIYQVACPHIVREFNNYSEFIASGYPNSYLLSQGEFHNIKESKTQELVSNMPNHQIERHRPGDIIEYKIEHNFRNSQKEYFDEVFNIANKSKSYVRLLTTIIIVLAIILMGIIIAQNILAVLDIYKSK